MFATLRFIRNFTIAYLAWKLPSEWKGQIIMGLPTKDETIKTTKNNKNLMIWNLILVSAFNFVFWWFMGWLRYNLVLAYKVHYMEEHGLFKFRTVVSEVSSFVGNTVSLQPDVADLCYLKLKMLLCNNSIKIKCQKVAKISGVRKL